METLGTVEAPWTPDQVRSLNAYQACGQMHPFTGDRGPNGEETVLIATTDGWIERAGGPVIQTWAHLFMANWSWQLSLL
jgi:hypothetical protein